jgi:hypothetical protein
MNVISKRSSIAAAISTAIGFSTGVPNLVSAASLADGYYDMIINNTPYNGSNFLFGSDGAWSSLFAEGGLPHPSGNTWAMYDDTVASPANGKYAGNPNDGVQGTVALRIEGGVITGTGSFEFDTIALTTAGDRVQYGSSSGFTGSIDASGNISLTPTGILAAFGAFPALVDERWNVDDYNGVGNPPNGNTVYDSFSTGSATTTAGTINGAAYDGTTAILVKAGLTGSDFGGFYGVQYFEVWNVSFIKTGELTSTVPVPAAVWLFGSGLLGLIGAARRKAR